MDNDPRRHIYFVSKIWPDGCQDDPEMYPGGYLPPTAGEEDNPFFEDQNTVDPIKLPGLPEGIWVFQERVGDEYRVYVTQEFLRKYAATFNIGRHTSNIEIISVSLFPNYYYYYKKKLKLYLKKKKIFHIF